jgi:hypothetical protein
LRLSLTGHQLSLVDADWPTASAGEQPFGGRGSVAVTGHFLTFSFARWPSASD